MSSADGEANAAIHDPLRITFFGTFDEAHHPRVKVLREGLADHGHHVENVNVPLALGTAGRVTLAAQPWRAPLAAMQLGATWLRLLARSARATRPDVVVVGYLGHFDVHLAKLRWPRAHIVLDHLVSLADTAQDRALDGRAGVVRALEVVDRAALAQADTVVVDTEQQATQVPAEHRSKTVVVLVGAPTPWFEAGAHVRDRDTTDPALTVSFFGLYTPLQGTPTIGEAIGKLRAHDVRWTMIGSGQDYEAAQRAAGDAEVTWLDWVDADALPEVVAEHDVCLGIFGTGPKAHRVVPNKVFQGAAAGCAIVTSDTPAQRAVLGDAALYVPPGDAGALADALASLAEDPHRTDALRQAAQDAASRFTPRAVVHDLSLALTRAHDGTMRAAARFEPPLPPNAALRWRVVRGHLQDLNPKRVLELGCGQGAFAARLAATYEYVGVEPDATSRAAAIAHVPDDASVVDRIDALDDDETFDLLCSFEVLEHIDDDTGTLARWVRHVEPGGHVMLSAPAGPDRFGPFDELAGHLRRYSADDLAALFESAGLEVVTIDHYGYPFGLALEAGRNRIARRRLARESEHVDPATRTATSGRHLQYPHWSGKAVWWGMAPFHMLQRRFADRGTGLVGVASRPL